MVSIVGKGLKFIVLPLVAAAFVGCGSQCKIVAPNDGSEPAHIVCPSDLTCTVRGSLHTGSSIQCDGMDPCALGYDPKGDRVALVCDDEMYIEHEFSGLLPLGTRFDGDYQVRHPADLRYLHPVSTVTGNLSVSEVTGLSTLSLPNLKSVFNLRISESMFTKIGLRLEYATSITVADNARLRVLSLARIENVARNLRIGGNKQLARTTLRATHIGGNLNLAGTSAINDFGLSIETIGGDFYPGNATMQIEAFGAIEGDLNLNYFTRDAFSLPVTMIGGSLHMFGFAPDSLVMNKLESIGGNLNVGESYTRHDHAYIEIDSLKEVSGSVNWYGNNYAPQITAPSLTRIGGDFVATHNKGASPQFVSVAQVDGTIVLQRNEWQSWELPQLKSIGGSMLVELNPKITDISLPDLDYIGQHLYLGKNSALERFKASQLSQVNGDAVFKSNPELCRSAIDQIVSKVDPAGATIVEFNNLGC